MTKELRRVLELISGPREAEKGVASERRRTGRNEAGRFITLE